MSETITAARLVDGATELVIIPDEGMGVVSLQIGLPSARVVAVPRTGINGTRDTTTLFGSRAVSMSFEASPTATEEAPEMQDRLHYFLAPSRRPYLVFTLAGQVERRLLLRPDSGSMTFTPGRTDAVDSVAQWVCPEGIIESQAEIEQTLTAAAAAEAGRSYDLTFDRTYPASSTVGAGTLTNAGNVDAYPVVKMYGPCTDPAIENQTTGQVFEMVGLSLLAGEYVELNMRERTVYLNSLTTQTRLQYVDFAVSDWWPLVPGVNSVRYYPTSFGAGAAAVVTFRSAWL